MQHIPGDTVVRFGHRREHPNTCPTMWAVTPGRIESSTAECSKLVDNEVRFVCFLIICFQVKFDAEKCSYERHAYCFANQLREDNLHFCKTDTTAALHSQGEQAT